MKSSPNSLVRWTLAALLLFAAAAAQASTSNKWRLQFSGGADSDGVIVIAIKDGTGENSVAKAVVEGLKEQLPKDHYHVERDDWEDVLIKKHHGDPNFGVEIVSNTVKGVRINPDRE